MKLQLITSFLAACCLLAGSCSKEKEDTPIDRTEEMKNTIWAGEFQYTTGEYTSPQPFSVSLAADGTLTWSDVTSTRPAGTWTMNGNTLSITFPNNTVISATVGNESWSDFKGGIDAGVILTQVSKAALFDPAAVNNASFSGVMGGSVLKITFLSESILQYKLGTGDPSEIYYVAEGAGIRFKYTGVISYAASYVTFANNSTMMNGLERYVSGFPSKVTFYDYTLNKE